MKLLNAASVITFYFAVITNSNAELAQSENLPRVGEECSTSLFSTGFCMKLDDCKTMIMWWRRGLRIENYLCNTNGNTSNGTTISTDSMVCCNVNDLEDTFRILATTFLPSQNECGISPGDRIYGGNITAVDEYPWTALIKYTSTRAGRSRSATKCGGSIINENHVLTAAHCIHPKILERKSIALLSVVLGEWDLSKEIDCDDCVRPIESPVIDKITHSLFDPMFIRKDNDIGLLRLNRRILPFTNYVRPICLPIALELKDKNYSGVRLISAGWGRSELERLGSNIKLKVGILVVNRQSCSSNVTDFQLCAGGETGVDTCNGDSGGPLMEINAHSQFKYWYLVGIVSYGPTQCGKGSAHGAYTRVDQFIEWILRNMR